MLLILKLSGFIVVGCSDHLLVAVTVGSFVLLVRAGLLEGTAAAVVVRALREDFTVQLRCVFPEV